MVNGTESEVTRTGLRTSTLIELANSPLVSYVVATTVFCCVLPPFAGNESVFQPGSVTSPVFVTQRYSTSTGTRPTVNVAVNEGAWAAGGGQLPR
jgi:hypothetical protein